MAARLSVPGLCLLGVLATVVISGCRDEADEPAFPQVEINRTRWLVDLATTQEQRYIGLSGRRNIREGTGMLFVFPEEQELTFVMRGCLVPLDIAFLDSDLRVVQVHTMAVEPDLAGRVPYRSKVPAQYALEVPAGELRAAGITIGDRAKLLGDIPDASKAEPGL